MLLVIGCLILLAAVPNRRRRVEGNRVIYRKVLSAHDNAVLQCVATNDHGSILANAALKVIGLSSPSLTSRLQADRYGPCSYLYSFFFYYLYFFLFFVLLFLFCSLSLIVPLSTVYCCRFFAVFCREDCDSLVVLYDKYL